MRILLLIIFSVFLVHSKALCQDTFEPNNSFETAKSINFGVALNAAITSSSDKDYFKIEISKPGVIIATLKNVPTNQIYVVSLFNASQQLITSDNGRSTDPAFINALRCSTGTYYIVVEGLNGDYWSPNQYELTVFLDSSDIYECNNLFSTATPIQFGVPVKASVYDEGDKDYYKIELSKPGVVIATLKNIPVNQIYVVSLFNASQQLVTSDNARSTDPAFIDALRCDIGTYYIVVEGLNGDYSSPTQYELTVFFDSSDIYECNNLFSTATPIQFGVPLKASVYDKGDKDYYKIEIPKSGVVRATLRNIPASQTYVVSLFNGSQQLVTSDSGNSTDPSFIDALRCGAGTNYIVVEGLNGDYWSPT
ncbi:MAG: hypothetical protein HC892_21735, partial [Saprospiraceae bacterium]|nr:hypothetical protein [Saprospiraceae bacterium]